MNYKIGIPGRGPTTVVAVRFPHDEATEVEKAAEELTVDRSTFVRRAVRRAIAEHHAQKVATLPERPASGPAKVIEFRETRRRGAA